MQHFQGVPGRDPLLREISPQLEKVPPAGPRAASSSAAGVGELYPARYRICLFGNSGTIYLLWVKVGLYFNGYTVFVHRTVLGYHFPACGLLFV